MTIHSRKRTAEESDLDAYPVAAHTWTEAQRIAQTYSIVIFPAVEGKFSARSIELPNVFSGPADSPAECARRMYEEGLPLTISMILERGDEPLAPVKIAP